jgi:hypothetical protein
MILIVNQNYILFLKHLWQENLFLKNLNNIVQINSLNYLTHQLFLFIRRQIVINIFIVKNIRILFIVLIF